MRIWTISPPEGEPELRLVSGDLLDAARAFIGGDDITLDFCRVYFQGRFCHMAVDDIGHEKNLVVNATATALYRAACVPGATHVIVGPTVVFDGLLP